MTSFGAKTLDGNTVTYGDVYHQNEVEQSTYNFEYSDADWLLRQFNDYEAGLVLFNHLTLTQVIYLAGVINYIVAIVVFIKYGSKGNQND